ncbi:DUF2922 domain-containing protein [Ligilactobacillus pobuzihii]|uniref:DUF2922 domain-containing protein n=1 Tax=Ligilactobacillus pobuzihii TaxID=449659 RepID=A0A0R2LHU3_9LACO|nr:DUF2922 domain-containing protein [Ligilactobacillus pobuzihii]KRK09321.1 hypothetical protein FD11_GL001009 [Ligilactobacillus pobuzihii E100301 = KCTC 13174]KRO01333.1 hypothetical protein IV66_GL000406 [Ligilactobacillus pobuzihii]GEN49066.1 hypothetical protein LPO01_18580 [Ligilactobacillus pobuzihii]
MKSLDLAFRSAIGGAVHHLKLKYVNTELDAETVKTAMQEIADAQLFVDKKGEEMYAKPVSATYQTEQDDVLFEEK